MSSISKALGRTAALAGLMVLGTVGLSAAVAEREPVTMQVVAVNPSTEKSQVVPVRIDLPKEVAPTDVLETGELSLEYDDDRGAYYVYKEAVALAPRETRIFQVMVKDVWFVPAGELDSLHNYAGMLMERLKGTEYEATAKAMADSVQERLTAIASTQNDDSLSRKGRIGSYRYHLQTLAQVKDDLARMEKLLTFTGGPPVPEMLEESKLKSDAPSQTTTWLVIFLILVFIGLLGGLFFFTWHQRTQAEQDFNIVRQTAFPPAQGKRPGSPAGKS